MCEICSKLTVKTPYVVLVSSNLTSNIFLLLVFSLLNMNKEMPAGIEISDLSDFYACLLNNSHRIRNFSNFVPAFLFTSILPSFLQSLLRKAGKY